MGIGSPEVCLSDRETDVAIISERGPLKKEAGVVQGVMARPEKRRGVAPRGCYFFLQMGIIAKLGK
jgi:hypothetical protein